MKCMVRTFESPPREIHFQSMEGARKWFARWVSVHVAELYTFDERGGQWLQMVLRREGGRVKVSRI